MAFAFTIIFFDVSTELTDMQPMFDLLGDLTNLVAEHHMIKDFERMHTQAPNLKKFVLMFQREWFSKYNVVVSPIVKKFQDSAAVGKLAYE